MLKGRYNTVIINALLAVVACLVINFSYLLAIREQDERDLRLAGGADETQEAVTGRLRISRDGYGYITPEAGGDSIYVIARLVRRLGLRDGSSLTVIPRDPWVEGGSPLMWRVEAVDGVAFDYGELYNNPGDRAVMGLQLVFYVIFAFVLLTIMTVGAARNTSVRFYLTRVVWCLVAAVVMWFLLPIVRIRSGGLTVMLFAGTLYPIDLLKCSFVVAVALLYGRTFQLARHSEQLKSENLRSRYNTLVSQINPHFLFNSLNSLSALVRGGKSDDAVMYIDRLADTFRYTVNSDADSTTTLAAELEFVGAYKYLLEVRYAGKLFIDIDVDSSKLSWRLPAFSLQPLVENAVKHNVITRAKPLRISIRTVGDRLVVSNPISPKIEPESGTGIGLKNLAHRWQLLTGRAIDITNDGETFAVSLPFAP